jgi:hypothetical protein
VETQVNQGLACLFETETCKAWTHNPLVSAHMAVNLLDNVHSALKGFPVTSLVGWLGSIVELHWIRTWRRRVQNFRG